MTSADESLGRWSVVILVADYGKYEIPELIKEHIAVHLQISSKDCSSLIVLIFLYFLGNVLINFCKQAATI